MKLKEKNDTEH
jgi:hypothetical protein